MPTGSRGETRSVGDGSHPANDSQLVEERDRTSSTFNLAGHQVHRVGYGAMQLTAGDAFGPPRDHATAIAVLRRAVELGVNHIDTAQFYGPGVSNALIREALHPYPDDLAIVSKVGARRHEDGSWSMAQEPDQLREDVEANLRALGVDRLAAVNLRLRSDLDDMPALEDQLAAMVQMRDDGLIGGVGISTATLEQVQQAIDTAGLVTVQNPYSLIDRADQDVLALCRRHGVAYAPYFPLGSALPGMPKVVDDPVVQDVARQAGATPAQVGLAWLLAHRPNVLLIPGTSTLAHLEENMAVTSTRLTDDQRAALDAVAAAPRADGH